MVVPIYDDNPFTQPIKPIVTWCLIAANLGVYWEPRLTPEQKAAQELGKILDEFPQLRERIIADAVDAGEIVDST